jgi:integrase/recombinase XerD
MKTTVNLLKGKFVKANGTVALYLYVYVNGEKDQIPLNLSWPADFVAEAENKLLPRQKNDKEANDYNLIIRTEIGKINDIFVVYRLSDRPLSLAEVKKEYFEYEKRKDFIAYMEKKINERFYRKKIAESTRKSHKNALLWLRAFQKSISFNELTKKLIEKYETWLQAQSNKRANDDKKLDKNTIANLLKYVKAYINLAIADGIAIENPFKKADVITNQDEKMIEHLLPQQVADLMNTYENEVMPLGEKLTLCRFLVACTLSLRISDILGFDENRMEYYRVARRLAFHPQKQVKTKRLKTVYVPIDNIAMAYLEDLIALQNKAIELGLKISEAYGRKVLKKIAHRHKMSIDGYHTGRHTFATNYLRAGGKVHELQQILGHTNIQTTMRYVHIVEEDQESAILMLSNFYQQYRQ